MPSKQDTKEMNMASQKINAADSCSANAVPDRQNKQTPSIDATGCSPAIAAEIEKSKRKCPESSPSIRSEAKSTNTSGFPSASSAVNPPPEKRQKSDPIQPNKSPDEQQLSFNAIESLLSVPISYILHKTSSQNKNPHLLSRMEASLLLQITTLSYELDALLQMSIEAVENSHACKKFSRDIDESRNVFLRPLHCLLHTHGRVIPQQVVQHVQNNLEGILGHFPVIIQSLKQCAEQNWSVSNALLGMSVDGIGVGVLGEEKGLLAEMEEEVCKRMEGLMDVCNRDGLLIDNSFDEESMECFCERLFKQQKSDGEDGNNSSTRKEPLLSMQSRTESICDAASALGMLAASSGA